MSQLVKEECKICGEVITEDEKIIELKSGIARNQGFFRSFFDILRTSENQGITWAHVNCVDNEGYDYQNPHKTLTRILTRLEI